jgi:hypothetical protein
MARQSGIAIGVKSMVHRPVGIADGCNLGMRLGEIKAGGV